MEDPHLHDCIKHALNNSKDGIQVRELEPGTKLSVETMNSTYEFLDGETHTISGGTCVDGSTRYEDPVPVKFHGSTFGGSILKMTWIGRGMCMEFFDGDKVMTTSPVKDVTVKDVTVKAPDGSWTYSMEWKSLDQV